ncbi:MAG: TonB-dependent receptor [Wenzhouxiangella sp.]
MPKQRPLPLLISLALTGMVAAPLAAQTGPERGDEELPRILVTADPLGNRSPDELIQPVNVLTGDELERRRASNLGEVLDGLPGVSNSDFGPGVGRPVVRGLQGSRVQVLEDGLMTADVSGEGADHAIGQDAIRAEQVEVFRGPATLLYGSGAAGGVVNVVTNRFSPVVPEVFQLDTRLSYGFNGNDRQGRLAAEVPMSDTAVLRADYNLRRTDNFDIKGFQVDGSTQGTKGELLASAIESDSASLSTVFGGDWGHFGVGVSYLNYVYDIPKLFDPRPRELGGLSDHFDQIDMESLRFDVRGEWVDPLAGFSLARLKMSHTRFEMDEAERFFTREPGGGVFDREVVEAEFDNTEWDARLEMVHNPIGNWRGVFGIQLTDRDMESNDPRGDDRGFYVRPNETLTLAAFLVEELPTDFGRIELGARIERVRSSADDVFGYRVEGVTLADGSFLAFPERLSSQTFTPFSLSAGAIFDIGSDYHLRTTITRSERAPSPEQLYAFGRHPSAGTFEIGNPDLGKEGYTNFEIGLDRHVGNFRFDASVFYNRVSDFIFLASEDDGTGNPVGVNDIGNRAGEGAAAGCEPGAGGLCRLRNQFVINEQSNAEFYGAEFAAVLDLNGGMALRLSGDHVRGKLRSGGGNLPRITPTRLGVGMDSNFGDFDLSVDYQRVFKQDNVAVAESETDGFNLVGFDLFWRPALMQGGALFFQGRNLLNEDGRRHQSFFKDDAPIIGRAFTTGVRYQFGG